QKLYTFDKESSYLSSKHDIDCLNKGVPMLQRLPLGISTFREIRENKDLYVDKTQYAYDLIMGTRRYFLSRPRRFGKSLLVSMMKEVLSGNKDLFNGLWIANSDYQWQTHGVITIDFSTLDIDS